MVPIFQQCLHTFKRNVIGPCRTVLTHAHVQAKISGHWTFTAVRLNPYTRYCQRRVAWGLIKSPRYTGYSQRRDSRSPILDTASGNLLWKQPSGCVGRIIMVVNVHFQLPFTFFLLSILNCITWLIFSHEQEHFRSNWIYWLIWPHKYPSMLLKLTLMANVFDLKLNTIFSGFSPCNPGFFIW